MSDAEGSCSSPCRVAIYVAGRRYGVLLPFFRGTCGDMGSGCRGCGSVRGKKRTARERRGLLVGCSRRLRELRDILSSVSRVLGWRGCRWVWSCRFRRWAG